MIRHLAGSIVFCLALALPCYALHIKTHEHLKRVQAQTSVLRKEAAELRQRYQRTAEDESTIRAAIGRYNALLAKGVIGPERRLDWADATRRTMSELGLQEGEFSLLPRKELTDTAAEAGRGRRFHVYASTMTWRAPLLHEGDLLHVLDTFAHLDSAIVAPRRCALAERAMGGHEHATLNAECEFDWLTLDPVAQSSTKASP